MLSTGEREITFKDDLLIVSKLNNTLLPFRFVQQKNSQAEFEVIYLYLKDSFVVLKIVIHLLFSRQMKKQFSGMKFYT